tara:strand:+ start:671 stop:1936 length:1266 start_codon:yes stop_codon:yes gene_type:complete
MFRPLGPAVSFPRLPEMLRACIGAGVGLTVCVFLVRLTMPPGGGTGPDPTLLLISSLGSTAMLVFSFPSSPLAQPWSAIVGNGISAAIGVAVVMTVDDPWIALGLSITGAMIAMQVLRAPHPPAAGVALGAVLTADSVREIGFSYVFSPVLMDTVLLLLVAVAYNRVTGRVYPFRQPRLHAPEVQGAGGLRPMLTSVDLAGILQRLRLDANIGAADLARLVSEAHRQAAGRLFDGVTTGQIMTRAVISLHPQMPLSDVAGIFRAHRVRTLPVVGPDGRYLGLVSEIDLLRSLNDPLAAPKTGTLSRMLRSGHKVALPVAADVMDTAVATALESTTLGALIDLLAKGLQQAVPVLGEGRLVGLVSRSDLIAALARAHKVNEVEDQPGAPPPASSARATAKATARTTSNVRDRAPGETKPGNA